jgi:hypothetical protein
MYLQTYTKAIKAQKVTKNSSKYWIIELGYTSKLSQYYECVSTTPGFKMHRYEVLGAFKSVRFSSCPLPISQRQN